MLTLLDLCPLPLANAWPTGIGKNCAAHLSEGVQHAIPLNGGPAIHLRFYTCQSAAVQPHSRIDVDSQVQLQDHAELAAMALMGD